jgi:N-acetylneuraminic acid mutarotase
MNVSPAILLAMSLAAAVSVSGATAWQPLPPLPDKMGFAGPFAGTHHGALLVGGGANFPDKLPWEGGTKIWYDTVFVLEQPDGAWRIAGKLARPLGYGVSLSTPRGIVCLGGSDAQRHYADAFWLRWENGALQFANLPALPRPCANFSGALIGNTIYVAGGIETPTSTNALKTFWALDLDAASPQWRELEPWPGPARMLATAAADRHAFYLFGGTALSGDAQGKPVREYLTDAYRYEPGQGWKRIANLPRPAVAAPTPAPVNAQGDLLVMGGDDGSLVSFQPLDRHPGFPKSILAYSPAKDTWTTAGELPIAHVTTTTVPWNGGWVMPTGEVRPGVRSPANWWLPGAGKSSELGPRRRLFIALLGAVLAGMFFLRRFRHRPESHSAQA